jgi:hypothetical protein
MNVQDRNVAFLNLGRWVLGGLVDRGEQRTSATGGALR